MSFIQMYDSVIHMIEVCIAEDKKWIPTFISRELGMNKRSLEESFRFITNQTLSKYIKERFLVSVYYECKDRKVSLESIAGKNNKDSSSLSRAFKSTFGKSFKTMTPEEMEKYRPLTFLELLKRDQQKDGDYSKDFNERINYQSLIQSLEINEEERILNHISKILKLTDEEVRYAHYLSNAPYYRQVYKNNIYQASCYVRKKKESICEMVSKSLSLKESIDNYLTEDEKTTVFLLSERHGMSPDSALVELRRLKEEGYSNILEMGNDFMEVLSYSSGFGIRMPGDTIQKIVEALHEKEIVIPIAFDMIGEMKNEGISFDEVLCKEKYKKFYGSASFKEEDYEDYNTYEDEKYKDPYDEYLERLLEESEFDDTSYFEPDTNYLDQDMEDMDEYIERMYLYSEFGDKTDSELNYELFTDYEEW